MHRLIGTLWLIGCLFIAPVARAHPTVEDARLESETERAYQYLEILPAQWAGKGTPSETNGEHDCRTYDSAHIRGLLPDMVIKVAAMAQAYEHEEGVVLMVLSAYRSPVDQECVCKNVPKHCAGWHRTSDGKDADGKPLFKMVKTGGVSRHQHRTAIDMRPAHVDVADDVALDAAYRYFYDWLKKNRERFGLCHPIFHIGDRAHIEPARAPMRMAHAGKKRGKHRRA